MICAMVDPDDRQLGALERQSDDGSAALVEMDVKEKLVRSEAKRTRRQPETIFKLPLSMTWELFCLPKRNTRNHRKKIEKDAALFAEFPELGRVDRDILEQKRMSIGDYNFEDELGCGSFGIVYSATKSDVRLAVKVLRKGKRTNKACLMSINQEIGLMRRHGHHPNLLGLEDVFHTPKHIYMVMERATMDLEALRDNTNAFDVQPDLLQQITVGVLEGLNYMHSLGISHLDCKPKNILIFTDALRDNQLPPGHRIEASSVRLADFGMSLVSDFYNPSNTEDKSDIYHKLLPLHDVRLQGVLGTPGYLAPEMVLRPCYEGRRADMYSLGTTLLDICKVDYGTKDFFDRLQFALYHGDGFAYSRIIDEYTRMHYRCSSRDRGDQLLHGLLFGRRGLLLRDPYKRVNAWEALHHPWFQVHYEEDGGFGLMDKVAQWLH